MQYQGSGKWAVCNPENVGGYSATAYFFARELHKVLGIPVGVINSSVGGTGIEAWTSLEAQQAHKDRELKPIFDRWANATATWDPDKARANYEKQVEKHKASAAKAKATKTKAPRAPTKPVYPPLDRNFPANLFNGKISPLIPYAIRGGIWYQGEHNSGLGQIYDLQLQLLIGDWRKRWGQGDFPFAWVQLPNYQKAQEQPVETQGWANIREAMLRALKIPNTGVAITIDVGEAGDIHPKNKQEVGRRLSLWALAKVYGQAKSYCGPIYRASKVEGGKMVIEFDHADGGLQARNGDLKTFAIAGADKKWVAAQARIEGNTVVVSSPEVKSPAAVRYGWASNPPCNLYNGAGVPASPFRTDNWE
jgi:sialate O-acetylesterase